MKYIINIPEDTKQHFDEFKGKFLCDNGYDLIQAIKDSKPLERELDKIRAEIENIDTSYYSSVNGVDMTECADDIKHGMLEIIDKYKSESEPQESDIEKRKPCINCEDGCEEWAGCPCMYYRAESEKE